MKQDVKVEGIPTNMNVNHNHHVVLEVELSQQTADRIKDVAVTVLLVMATTAISKSLVGTANRIVLDREYYKIWSKK